MYDVSLLGREAEAEAGMNEFRILMPLKKIYKIRQGEVSWEWRRKESVKTQNKWISKFVSFFV